MRIDLLTLKLFVAVFEEESLAKAAEREHIAASAISKRIADLELSLKVELFHRHRTGLQPTPAGHALMHHARVLMRDVAQMESELVEYAQGVRGNIRIYANISALVQYLPGDLSSFLALHPLVRVDLEEAISTATVRAVADNLAEIGIYGANIPAPGLKVLPYRQDKLILVVPRGHALAGRPSVKLADALPYDLVGVQKGSSIDTLVVKAATELEQPVKLRIRASGFDAVCRMVEAGLGVGVMPDLVALNYTPAMAIEMVKLDEPWAARQLNICVRDMNALSAAAGLLVRHLSRR